MIKTHLFIIFSIAFLTISCNQTDKPTNSPVTSKSEVVMEKELRDVVMKIWEDVVKGDTVSLKAAHLNSQKFSKFGPRISARQNFDSTIKTETEHFSSITEGNLDIEDIKVDIFGDVAITTFYNNYSFTKNNERIQGKGRVSLVFFKTVDGWKIIHEHSSAYNE